MDEREAFRWSIRMLAHVAGEFQLAWCAGSESCLRRFRWTREKPSPGDLVVEMSMHHWPQGPRVDHFARIGRYLGTTVNEHEDGWRETVHVIVLADGTVFRWANCDLRRVPEETLANLLEAQPSAATE